MTVQNVRLTGSATPPGSSVPVITPEIEVIHKTI